MIDPMLLSDAAERYIAATPELRTERAQRSMRAVPVMLSDYLTRPATVEDLTVDTARLWLAYRATVVGRWTVRVNAGRLLTLWRWLALQDVVDPVVCTPLRLCPATMPTRRPSGVTGPSYRVTPRRRGSQGFPVKNPPPYPRRSAEEWLRRMGLAEPSLTAEEAAGDDWPAA